MSEPFWCEELGKYLKIISAEEADRICCDIQLYYCSNGDDGMWEEDLPPTEYRKHPPRLHTPSHFPDYINAIEVDPTKPEYEPL